MIAEVAVNKRVDAAVGSPQPLGYGHEVALYKPLLPVAQGRPEQNAHAYGVKRKPGQREHGGDGDEHSDDAYFGFVDVPAGLGALNAGHGASPDAQAYQSVEHGDHAHRDQVAGEEYHPQVETPLKMPAPKLRVAESDHESLAADVERVLAVVERPRCLNADRHQPDDADDHQGGVGVLQDRLLAVEDGDVSETKKIENSRCQLRQSGRQIENKKQNVRGGHLSSWMDKRWTCAGSNHVFSHPNIITFSYLRKNDANCDNMFIFR